MKNKKLFFLILGICLLLVVIGIGLTPKEQKPARENKNCGIQNCHGLEIACGSNIPEVCTLEYAIGDGCRQFAECQIVNGECRLVKSTRFESCKSCVEQCLANFKNDPVKLSMCDGECSNK